MHSLRRILNGIQSIFEGILYFYSLILSLNDEHHIRHTQYLQKKNSNFILMAKTNLLSSHWDTISFLRCQVAPSRCYCARNRRNWFCWIAPFTFSLCIHAMLYMYIQLHHQMGYHLFGCSFIADFFFHCCIFLFYMEQALNCSACKAYCIWNMHTCILLQHHFTVIEFIVNILLFC